MFSTGFEVNHTDITEAKCHFSETGILKELKKVLQLDKLRQPIVYFEITGNTRITATKHDWKAEKLNTKLIEHTQRSFASN